MELYRITKEQYASKLEASGRANRWNTDKQYVVYASSSRSLATLELVAHRNAIMEGVEYKMVVILVPEQIGFIQTLDAKKLVPNWHLLENRSTTQKYGSEWYLNKRSAILKVPSAIIKEEYNYILNTMHPDFSKIRIKHMEEFTWDKRLL